MKLRRNKKGFTIVELVIVIAVIGVLAAVLIPVFVNLTNKANKASDESLVKNLNTSLAMQEQEVGDTKNNTMHDAVLDLDLYGYNLPNLVTKSDDKLLWNQKTNRFILEDRDADEIAKYAKTDFWRIQDSIETNQEYSVYAGRGFRGNGTTGVADVDEKTVNIGVGFDAGYHEDLSSINYAHTGNAQEINIRTNGGDVVVNAPADIVHHYAGASIVTIEKIADLSYHEHGYVSFMQVEQGHVSIENEGGVGTLYITSENANVTIEAESEVDIVLAATAEAGANVEGGEAIVTTPEQVDDYKESAARFGGGLGTEESPYLIKDEFHFSSIDEDVKNDVTSDKHYKLINDFRFDDFGMIGSMIYKSKGQQSGEVESVHAFSGVLDGNSHAVSFTYQETTYSGGAGLFASIENAKINNLTLNANVTKVTPGYAAGLAAELCNSQITNVTINGTIRGYKALGGFAGLGYTLNNDNPTVFTNCTNNATIINNYNNTASGYNYAVAGGFIGEGSVYNYAGGSWGGSYENSMTFNNCVNNGKFIYNGTTEKTIACFSNLIGFSSDAYYGTFHFNNCSAGNSVSYQGTIATQKAAGTKTVLTGYSVENAAIAPTIKYIGISSNVWSANTAKNHIYVNGELVEGSTGDHILA